MKLSRLLLLGGVLLLLLSCQKNNPVQKTELSPSPAVAEEKPRVLYINSYNPEFPWSEGILRGILSVFQASLTNTGEINNTNSLVDLRVFHMRTLLDQSQKNIDYAVGEARAIIHDWKPDVVIASDDNASKYLIVPYYRESSIPFLFCGLNWNADDYGFPTDNVTGILEVSQASKVIDELLPYAGGERIVFLRARSNTSQKEARYLNETLKYPFEAVLVGSYGEWKREFIRLQDDADILLTTYPSSMQDWDGDEKALHYFMEENTRIPTGGWDVWMAENVLVTIANVAEEQGEWTAKTALEILGGKNPADIPIAKNIRGAYYLNMRLAKKLNIFFPLDLIEKSHMVNTLENTHKILYVNSYHEGYEWSDEIESAFVRSMERSALNYELRFFRMNTKINQDEAYMRAQARSAADIIGEWKPDIVCGSDDNFVKYLVMPYLLGEEMPVVYCGVNWDASEYGLPAENVTGMIEVDPLEASLEYLRRFSRGDRLGLIFRDEDFNYRINRIIQDKLGIPVSRADFVSTYGEWKKSYLSMQEEVDILILFSPVGIENWDYEDVLPFIYGNTRIPVATTIEQNIPLALLGDVKIAEEQGWWMGKTVIALLDGTPMEGILPGINRESRLVINAAMAKRLGFIIPRDLLEKAILWNGEMD